MNRRRYDNVIHLAPIATWVLLAIFAGGGGLFFVDCKVQAHKRAEKIKLLERELAEVRLANEAVSRQIEKLSSPNMLRKQRQMDKNFLADYVEITPDRLVVVTERPGSDLRPVSNTHRE